MYIRLNLQNILFVHEKSDWLEGTICTFCIRNRKTWLHYIFSLLCTVGSVHFFRGPLHRVVLYMMFVKKIKNKKIEGIIVMHQNVFFFFFFYCCCCCRGQVLIQSSNTCQQKKHDLNGLFDPLLSNF